MARMSDFHVVGDPRFAPDVPSGGGGVSQEYVDNADIEVKKTTAKGHNTKYDESVIPSQYTNKLYVYGNSETMYPVSEIGKYINFPSGRTTADYHRDDQETRSNWVIDDYKIYGKDESTNIIYDKLFAAKCINPADTRLACYVVLSAHKDVEIIANPNYASSPWNSIIRNASGSVAEDRSKMYMMMWDTVVTPPRPREFEEISMQERFTGNLIADNYFINNQYYNCQVTGMPLFVINSNSQSEFDKINRYIKENDYSGAVNASELDQYYKDSIVAIDVISGNWYNIVNDIWVKQGTLELSVSDDMELSDLTDVNINNIQNGQILIYNATAQKWENANESGGTPVVANPSGTATADLNKIQVDNTIYQIPQGGGGSGDVVPNPTGTPTETLETLGFNDILNDYYLENGLVGASGGSYVYCNLDKNMESGLTYKVILRDGSSVYTSEFGWEGSTKTINISGFKLTVQSTKAGLTYYSGAYRNIYCDIYTEYTETIIYQIEGGGGGGASNLSDLSDVELSNLSDGQILQYNSTSEKWENANDQGSLPFEFVIDPTDNGINIVYDDSILNGGE